MNETAPVRAGFVITGTEVLAGRVRDRNGPWLADRLAEMGVELAHVLITGDRPADLLAALEFMRAEGVDLIATSGGLGPTADDLTAQVVADFAGRPLELDEALERRIGDIIARFARRWNIDMEAVREANRKQAMVPRGAVALDPVGTAPGLVVPAGERVVVVLHYGHGYTLAEIGELIDERYDNVRAIASRARRKLLEAWLESER